MSVLRDLRLAFRLFWHTPLLTGVALLSIALSVGATAVVFTAIRAVLLNPFPYAHPEQLVQMRTDFIKFEPSHSDWVLWNDAQEVVRRTRTLASVGMYRNEIFNLAGDASTTPEALYGLRVSANLFPTLGVTPMLGRNILPEEDQLGHSNEMILSYGLWTRRFNADPNLVGRNVIVNGHDCLVIGVMPPEFNFPLRRGAVHTPSPYVEFWAPLRSGKPVSATEALGLVGRLHKGVSLSEAQQDLATISAELSREFPATNRDHVLRMGLLEDRTIGSAKDALWFLMAAAGMFMLIGCANVANLLLARGLARQREMAIRLAIGASGSRILRQLRTESCALAMLGGITGYAITVAAWKVLPALAPVSIPRLASARADGTVLAFCLIITLVNGVVFGTAPAFRAGWTRAITAQDLRMQAGSTGRRDGFRGALVGVEVALAMALVVVGGQLLGSFVALLKTDPGFEADRVIASVVIPAGDRYKSPEQHRMLYQHILESVRTLPGVESVGTIDALPFSGENHGGLVGGGEAGGLEKQDQIPAEIDVVSAGYLQTMGVRLADGRWFSEDDMKDLSDAVIVNEVVARRLWAGTSAVDKRICMDCSPGKPENWKRVIGIVSSIRHAAMDGPEGASVYLSASALENAAFLVVRTDRPKGEMEKAIRRAVAGVDPNQPVFLSASMREFISDSLADRRFIMALLAITGCLALAMAMAGVYGVATYTTTRRTQEIGVRMALGATPSNVQALVFRQGFLTAAAGSAIGLGLALVLIHVLRGVLLGLDSRNAGDLWMEVGLVLLTAAFACWLPARRAAKVSPSVALRQE
jgi:predicted permease